SFDRFARSNGIMPQARGKLKPSASQRCRPQTRPNTAPETMRCCNSKSPYIGQPWDEPQTLHRGGAIYCVGLQSVKRPSTAAIHRSGVHKKLENSSRIKENHKRGRIVTLDRGRCARFEHLDHRMIRVESTKQNACTSKRAMRSFRYDIASSG